LSTSTSQFEHKREQPYRKMKKRDDNSEGGLCPKAGCEGGTQPHSAVSAEQGWSFRIEKLLMLQLRLIRQRRVVQHDTQCALFIFLVTPAFVHLGDVAIFIGEGYPAHPHGHITLDETG